MSPFGDCALETRVEGIAREEGEKTRLGRVVGVRPVVVDDGLETRDATDWFCRAGSEGSA